MHIGMIYLIWRVKIWLLPTPIYKLPLVCIDCKLQFKPVWKCSGIHYTAFEWRYFPTHSLSLPDSKFENQKRQIARLLWNSFPADIILIMREKFKCCQSGNTSGIRVFKAKRDKFKPQTKFISCYFKWIFLWSVSAIWIGWIVHKNR